MFWLIVGAIAAGVAAAILISFWDEIRNWLATTFLDWVETNFGIKARNSLYEAIVQIDKVATGIRRRVIGKGKIRKWFFFEEKRNYVYEDILPTDYLPPEVRKELTQKGQLVQQYILEK